LVGDGVEAFEDDCYEEFEEEEGDYDVVGHDEEKALVF
jgi:hypothetical protein